MSDPVIKVENLIKEYRLGTVNHGTLAQDIQSLWAKLRGKEDPNSLITAKHKVSSSIPFLENPHFLALNDVSFEVCRGEIVGIIGRNGAGKSTLLKILSSVTAPSSGTVKLKGRVASLLEVGTGFHPELTGRENVFLNGAILGMGKIEIARKFEEIVAFAEVEQFIDTPVKRYSSGMYVRLAFAVAAHLEPEILIVDEVLAVGDAQFQKKCLGRLGEAGKEGRTVFFVSHNLRAIRSMCTRTILLSDGKIEVDGNPETAIAGYVGGDSDKLSMEWTDIENAPQNESAILKSVKITDRFGADVSEIYINKDFTIKIEYSAKKDNCFVGFTIIICDEENNQVFSSINNHEPNYYGKHIKIGNYVTLCNIPKNLLNNRKYILSLIFFGSNYTDSKIISDIIKIEILDDVESRGDYFGHWSGLIRPMLEWETFEI